MNRSVIAVAVLATVLGMSGCAVTETPQSGPSGSKGPA
jgi:hypothetical protein